MDPLTKNVITRAKEAAMAREASRNLEDLYWSYWSKAQDVIRRALQSASMNSLKEAKFQLSNLGLDLDLKRSGITSYRVGSDSTGADIYLTLRDMWDRGDALDAETISMSVFDACGFEPRPEDIKQTGPGVWTVQKSIGG